MKIFVTGSSGFIGSVVTNELINSGYKVIGLARSDKSAEAIAKAGATPLRGSLEDLDSLKQGAGEADGVINLGFNHDFSQFGASIQAESKAIEVMGEVLKGTGRSLIIASGGPTLSEKFDQNVSMNPREVAARKVLELAQQNVRSSVVRLPPTVHDETKCGFVNMLIDIARRTGVSGYVGDGSNRWSAVHRLDAAHLFCLALEKAPAGSVLQGVGDEGIPLKEIAEKIGAYLNLPVRSIANEDVEKHFGFLGRIVGTDMPASSAMTQKLLGWQPTHPGLLDDLDHGHFFNNPNSKES
jgi:nucleoside-diphosphate-sugar epimerase